MKKFEVKEFLRDRPGYLKKSPKAISDILNIDLDICKEALKEARREYIGKRTQVNTFETSSKVSKLKRWQLPDGSWRESVSYENDKQAPAFDKEELLSIIKESSPISSKIKHKKNSDPVMLEISLPDLHFGKGSLDQLVTEFVDSVVLLVEKSAGLNIERISIAIGNDGMNSEGMRRATTKGTPQEDSDSWRQTFRTYWTALISVIDYLQTIAPVDVIVVQGNHDFERMFYAGDVISAYYIKNPNVTVNNSYDIRKYYEYGKCMLLYTHGDNEKPHDLPLIMATEKPEMFARTKHREAHLGHLHKEMLNEYRGIKVRNLPSICSTDEWHKKMGYDHYRCAQAYIWSPERGLEGFLQVNIN